LPDWFSDGEEEIDFNFGTTVKMTQNFQDGIKDQLDVIFKEKDLK